MSDAEKNSANPGYEAMNASYRMMDEYMRQAQQVAERLWAPWTGPGSGGASPYIPPEQWVRAYGDMTRVWISMAQSWTRGMGAGPWTGAGQNPYARQAPHSQSGPGHEDSR